jgi:RNA polymerase sigma factor (sigma-70 family)
MGVYSMGGHDRLDYGQMAWRGSLVQTIAADYERPLAKRGSPVTGRRPAAGTGRNSQLRLLAAEFDRCYAIVYRYLLHRLFDAELAEELAAQTFYKAAVAIHRLPGDAKGVRLWLLRTATNLANSQHRRTRLRRLLLGRFGATIPTVTQPESVSKSIDGNRPARVRAAVLALRPKYQAVVVLRYFAEMSFDEIAAIVGCRPDAVRARLSRAIGELRERLGNRCSVNS